LQLLAQSDGASEVHAVQYNEGLKYPHLVRRPGRTDYLQRILAPKPVGHGA
jgi:hypothetical protein